MNNERSLVTEVLVGTADEKEQKTVQALIVGAIISAVRTAETSPKELAEVRSKLIEVTRMLRDIRMSYVVWILLSALDWVLSDLMRSMKEDLPEQVLDKVLDLGKWSEVKPTDFRSGRGTDGKDS